jgi:hypothetical protein
MSNAGSRWVGMWDGQSASTRSTRVGSMKSELTPPETLPISPIVVRIPSAVPAIRVDVTPVTIQLATIPGDLAPIGPKFRSRGIVAPVLTKVSHICLQVVPVRAYVPAISDEISPVIAYIPQVMTQMGPFPGSNLSRLCRSNRSDASEHQQRKQCILK